MRAAYLFGTNDLRFVETKPPLIGADDVRVEVAKTGICGTDIHVYQGMAFGPASGEPRPFGHEFSGRVTEVGGAVQGFCVGDRVTAVPSTPCGRCSLCRSGKASVCQSRVGLRGGSWAASVVAPAQNLFHLPDDVSDELGAATEPMACAVRAVERAGITPGDRVCVVGAGTIGLFVTAVAKASGASSVIVSEPKAYRRDLATRVGADAVIDPAGTDAAEAVRALTGGLGAEVVIEAVGVPRTIEQAATFAAPGATLLIVGVPDAAALVSFPGQDFYAKEITIRGTRGPTHMVERAIRLLATLDVAPVVTHTFPLAHAVEAIELSVAGNAGKVMLQP